MKLNNDFNKDELRGWFDGNIECWICGKSHWDAFHHIMGRGSVQGGVESSILNACPINNHSCHLPNHGALRTEPNQKILLQKNIRYLLSKGYILSERDKAFIQKYIKLYELD